MLLDKINRDIEKEYERKRKKAEIELANRRNDIYEAIPQVKQIDEYMRGLGILLGYRALNRNPSSFIIKSLPKQYVNLDVEQIKSEIGELEHLKENLLIKNGYTSYYLTNTFECNECNDTGYISGHDGTSKACTCRKIIYSQKLKSISGVPNTDIFENFDVNYYCEKVNREAFGISVSPKEQMEGVYRRCKLFVEQFEDKSRNNMIFEGKAGLGKTFLANCIINALTDKGYSCLYVSATDLFKYFAPGFYDRDDCSEMVEFILNCNLLVIDDLGSEKQTETRYAELLDILNKRESNNKNKLCKTIITTNMMPTQIKKNYDERVFSRIYGDYDLLKFAGEDIRLVKKQTCKR